METHVKIQIKIQKHPKGRGIRLRKYLEYLELTKILHMHQSTTYRQHHLTQKSLLVDVIFKLSLPNLHLNPTDLSPDFSSHKHCTPQLMWQLSFRKWSPQPGK